MIKKYTTADEEKLKKLISIIDGDSDVIHITATPNCKCSFAAYDQGEMVGFLVAWKSSFHPFCTYFKIISLPEQNTSIGELIAIMDGKLREKDYPLQTGVYEDSPLDTYYRERNFDIIRKTFLPTIHLPYKGKDSKNTTNLKIKSLDEIFPSQMEQLVSLAKRIYEETHVVNPVAKFQLDKWKDLIFVEDLIRDGSYVMVDEKEEILAYSLLHESDNKGTVEFGWKGTRNKSELYLINILVSTQIQYVERKGYKKMEGEFDTTDPYAMEVFNHFSFPRRPVWVTYQKK